MQLAADMRRHGGSKASSSAASHEGAWEAEEDRQHGGKGSGSSPGHERSGKRLALAMVVIFSVQALPFGPLPSWCMKLLIVAGLLYLLLRLLSFQRWADEHRYVPRFLACFMVMLVELAWENCMVWLVSAWDTRKYDNVPGLQDNVELAALWLAERSTAFNWFLHARWANTLQFLGAVLALAFSVLWDQVPYSGFGMMSRVVLTIAASRVLRVASFMCTVLPNPRPGCYARRFPPVPDGLWETIKVGYRHIRGFGGCNDLVFSGHGAFWVMAPLAVRDYYKNRWVEALLWVALTHASLKDVVERWHYSVDMLLAVVVTWAVWTWLEWVYPPATSILAKRSKWQAPDKPNPFVLGLIAFALLACAIIVIGGKA